MNNYEDIINLPHHVSEKRRHMSVHDRAAQFAPFAALTGFEEEIEEAARNVAGSPESEGDYNGY